MAETIFGHDRLDVYRLAMKFDGVAQSQTEYNAIDDYEHEHRRKRLSTSTMNCLSQNGNGLGILPRKTLAGPAKPIGVARPETVDLARINAHQISATDPQTLLPAARAVG